MTYICNLVQRESSFIINVNNNLKKAHIWDKLCYFQMFLKVSGSEGQTGNAAELAVVQRPLLTRCTKRIRQTVPAENAGSWQIAVWKHHTCFKDNCILENFFKCINSKHL